MVTSIIVKQVKRQLDKLSINGLTPQSIYIKAGKVIFKYPNGAIKSTEIDSELDELKNTLQKYFGAKFVSLYIETPPDQKIRYAIEYTKNGEKNILKNVVK